MHGGHRWTLVLVLGALETLTAGYMLESKPLRSPLAKVTLRSLGNTGQPGKLPMMYLR